MTRHHAEMRRLAARYARKAHTERMAGQTLVAIVSVGILILAYLFWLCATSPTPLAAVTQLPGLIWFGYLGRRYWRAAQQRSDEFLQLRQEALDEQ